MHDHRGAIANENAIDRAPGEHTRERVVVARDHRKLAAFDLRAEKILAAHDSPRSRRSELVGKVVELGKRSLSIALVPVEKTDQVPDLHATLEGGTVH